MQLFYHLLIIYFIYFSYILSYILYYKVIFKASLLLLFFIFILNSIESPLLLFCCFLCEKHIC